MRRLDMDSESGAIVVLVAVIMIVLLLGVALVVDSGRVYHEHHMLRNGADAASLAVAFDCARDVSACSGSATPVAQQYLDANAHDGISALDPGSTLPSNPYIDFGEQTVTVDALSLEPGGTPAVTLSLERSDGTTTAQVRARAVAKWGPAAFAQGTLPLTISFCEYEIYLAAQGGVLHSEPPPGPGHTIIFQSPQDAPTCDAHPGFDLDGDDPIPAGFGFLGHQSCDYVIEHHSELEGHFWAPASPSVVGGGPGGPSAQCLAANQTFIIPVYVGFREGTPVGDYLLYAPAAFHVTGYRFPVAGSVNAPCGPPETCISGHFVTKTTTSGQFGSGPGFGVNTAKIIE